MASNSPREEGKGEKQAASFKGRDHAPAPEMKSNLGRGEDKRRRGTKGLETSSGESNVTLGKGGPKGGAFAFWGKGRRRQICPIIPRYRGGEEENKKKKRRKQEITRRKMHLRKHPSPLGRKNHLRGAKSKKINLFWEDV